MGTSRYMSFKAIFLTVSIVATGIAACQQDQGAPTLRQLTDFTRR